MLKELAFRVPSDFLGIIIKAYTWLTASTVCIVWYVECKLVCAHTQLRI